MVEATQAPWTDLAHLPPVGTPQRLEWDRTIREANELYPDWSSIGIGRARFSRDTYEKAYKAYYAGTGRRWRPTPHRPKPPSPRSPARTR
jgi:hypothetical protein